jgi:hypothetical protein
VRETAPATPPAMKEATTGLEIALRNPLGRGTEGRSGVAAIVVLAVLESWKVMRVEEVMSYSDNGNEGVQDLSAVHGDSMVVVGHFGL